MNEEAITRVLEALYHVAEDMGVGDQAARVIFDFACMITFFKVGDEARQHIERDIRFLVARMDSWKKYSAAP